MNILFISDLDNTLVYSYKKKFDNDICIEKINENDQGFVSPCVYENLPKLNVTFVPITSRSIELYKRLNFIPNIARYAITTNGGVLFNRNEIDKKWCDEQLEIANRYKKDFLLLDELCSKDEDFKRNRMVDSLYYFLYVKDEVNPVAKYNEYKVKTKLDTVLSGKKIYISPPEINKGNALKKFLEMNKFDIVIAAGDGELDPSFLNLADVAIIPKKLENKVHAKEIFVCNEERFSDFIIQTILKITKDKNS